jgi:4-amino-4-deoxy-L-arabinose transferase-like glycosyltransferase
MLSKIVDRYGLVIAVLTAGVLFLGFLGSNRGLWWDEAVYLGLAKNVYSGSGYFINLGEESFRPPLFPAITAALWKVTPSETAALLMSPLFAIASVVATYLLAKRLFGKRVAFLSAMLLATSAQFLVYSERFLTESLFVLLGTLAMYVFYLGTERKERFYFPLAGLLIACTFLTRYAGLLLFSVYFLYPVLTKKGLLKRPDYWAGILVFILAIIPWFMMSTAYYGSPLGSYFAAQEAVNGVWYGGPPQFYIGHWINIFGFAGLLMLPGLYVLLKRRRGSDAPVIVMFLVSLVFFMFFVQRKEERYLLHFLSFFCMVSAIGFEWLRVQWKRAFPVFVSVILAVNIMAGFAAMDYGRYSSSALTEAGKLIGLGSGAIISNDVPVLSYLTGRPVYTFPENSSGLVPLMEERNASFIVLDIYEPTYPAWVWSDGRPSGAFAPFVPEKQFQEFGRTVVWVFRR